jgi:hypothetical protein
VYGKVSNIKQQRFRIVAALSLISLMILTNFTRSLPLQWSQLIQWHTSPVARMSTWQWTTRAEYGNSRVRPATGSHSCTIFLAMLQPSLQMPSSSSNASSQCSQSSSHLSQGITTWRLLKEDEIWVESIFDQMAQITVTSALLKPQLLGHLRTLPCNSGLRNTLICK